MRTKYNGFSERKLINKLNFEEQLVSKKAYLVGKISVIKYTVLQ